MRRPKTEVAVLGAEDPPPWETVNIGGKASALLICDHASRALPRAYGGLGLDETLLRRHIAWDIGAADITRRLASRLDAPALLAGYSRLMIDCNREMDDPTSIVTMVDGVAIAGNRKVDGVEAERRAAALFRPYHDAIEEALGRFATRGVVPALISIHSFTPIFGAVPRPWHIGVLWDKDPRLARPLLEALSRQPRLTVGDNQPYSGRVAIGYSIEVHGAQAGLPHVLIEVRQDLIDTHHGAEAWGERLSSVIGRVLDRPSPFRIARY